jgi:hypothetical protein
MHGAIELRRVSSWRGGRGFHLRQITIGRMGIHSPDLLLNLASSLIRNPGVQGCRGYSLTLRWYHANAKQTDVWQVLVYLDGIGAADVMPVPGMRY